MAHKFIFYLAPHDVGAESACFSRAESHYISDVLRLSVGKSVEAVDGLGSRYILQLQKLDGGRWWGRIVQREITEPGVAVPISLALPCLKLDRWESALEAACELGIETVWLTHYRQAATRWSKARQERAQRKAIEALKQSRGSRLTQIRGPLSLAQLLSSADFVAVWMADPDGEALPPIAAGSLLIIGPAAGLHPEEDAILRANRVRCFSLGKRRLRSEIASVAALAQAARMVTPTQIRE